MSPLTTADIILTIRDVVKRTTISRAQLYRLMTEGRFPRPLSLSQQRIGWRASDIDRWISALSANATRGHKQASDTSMPAKR